MKKTWKHTVISDENGIFEVDTKDLCTDIAYQDYFGITLTNEEDYTLDLWPLNSENTVLSGEDDDQERIDVTTDQVHIVNDIPRIYKKFKMISNYPNTEHVITIKYESV